MTEQLTPERAVRLLRAKAGELEHQVRSDIDAQMQSRITWLAADIALIAGLLADHIERTDKLDEMVLFLDAERKGMEMDLARLRIDRR